MKKLQSEDIKSVLYKGNKKDILKSIGRECFNNHIGSNNISKFLNDEYSFNLLKTNEKIAIAKGIFNSTHLDFFSVDGLFTHEELKQYNNSKGRNHLETYLEFNFIGDTSNDDISEDKAIEILATYDDYQLNKLSMLNERYKNKRTKITYFTIYQTNIHEFETNKKKDIMYFTSNEIEEMLNTLVGIYDTTRQNILSFIRLYCDWALGYKIITKNPCDDVNVDKTKTNTKSFLENKIVGKSDFYKMLEDMEKVTKLPNVIPLLLARYGIIGENLDKMINLKWEDIDMENKVVFIYNEGDKRVVDLPVDDKFIEYIKKAKLYSESPKMEGKNMVRYSDYGYVLKKAYNEKDVENEDKTVKYATVFNRVNDCCKSIGVPRIPFKTLLLSRQIEILLEIRQYGRLQQKDLEYVVKLFNFSPNFPVVNKAFQLKKRWQELTGDIVETQRKDTRNLPEENSQAISLALKKKLDLYV